MNHTPLTAIRRRYRPAAGKALLARSCHGRVYHAANKSSIQPLLSRSSSQSSSQNPDQKPSIKDRIHELACTNDFDALLEIALSASDEEIASLAVMELSTEANSQCSAMLQELARGSSAAAILAVVALFKLGHVTEAVTIFQSRMVSGDLLFLVKNGKESAFHALNILGCMDDDKGTQSLCRFSNILRGLNESERIHFLSRILGDPRPNGPRYEPAPNRIVPAVKLKAIDILLSNFIESEVQRPLLYAARDRDEEVSRKASEALLQIWRRQQPQNFRCGSPVQDFNFIVRACLLARSADRNIDAETTSIEEVRKFADEICATLDLPKAQLSVSECNDRDGAYYPGRGVIEISQALLSKSAAMTDELTSTVLHEIQHLEQDVLVLKAMASHFQLTEDEKREFKCVSDRELDFWRAYSAWAGQTPELTFVQMMLNAACDQSPLSDEQHERAANLYKDVLNIIDRIRSACLNSKKRNSCRSYSRRFAANFQRRMCSSFDVGKNDEQQSEEFDEQLIILRRAGSHEAEATQVADRAEIVLKAIRNRFL